MGGVYADETPTTMPSIPNTLNRFSRCSGHGPNEVSSICFVLAWYRQYFLPEGFTLYR
jgi:hypothetical protein